MGFLKPDPSAHEKSSLARRVEQLTGLEVTGRYLHPTPIRSRIWQWVRKPQDQLTQYDYDIVSRDPYQSRFAEDLRDAVHTLNEDFQLVDLPNGTFSCAVNHSIKTADTSLCFSHSSGQFKRTRLEEALECIQAKRTLAPYIKILRVTADAQDYIFTIPEIEKLNACYSLAGFAKSDIRQNTDPVKTSPGREIRINKTKFRSIMQIEASSVPGLARS